MVWKTKDGRDVPVAQLGDEHLQNILRMLLRRSPMMREAQALGMALSTGPSGEMARDAFDMEVERLERVDLVTFLRDYTPHWRALLEEAERRFGPDAVALLIERHKPTRRDELTASAAVLGLLKSAADEETLRGRAQCLTDLEAELLGALAALVAAEDRFMKESGLLPVDPIIEALPAARTAIEKAMAPR